MKAIGFTWSSPSNRKLEIVAISLWQFKMPRLICHKCVAVFLWQNKMPHFFCHKTVAFYQTKDFLPQIINCDLDK
jgi:hypothetical protein